MWQLVLGKENSEFKSVKLCKKCPCIICACAEGFVNTYNVTLKDDKLYPIYSYEVRFRGIDAVPLPKPMIEHGGTLSFGCDVGETTLELMYFQIYNQEVH